MARRAKAAKRLRTLREMDHENGDHIPSHRGFPSQEAERALEQEIARQLGVTDPARVSGDVMTREKERYLESQPKKGRIR